MGIWQSGLSSEIRDESASKSEPRSQSAKVRTRRQSEKHRKPARPGRQQSECRKPPVGQSDIHTSDTGEAGEVVTNVDSDKPKNRSVRALHSRWKSLPGPLTADAMARLKSQYGSEATGPSGGGHSRRRSLRGDDHTDVQQLYAQLAMQKRLLKRMRRTIRKKDNSLGSSPIRAPRASRIYLEAENSPVLNDLNRTLAQRTADYESVVIECEAIFQENARLKKERDELQGRVAEMEKSEVEFLQLARISTVDSIASDYPSESCLPEGDPTPEIFEIISHIQSLCDLMKRAQEGEFVDFRQSVGCSVSENCKSTDYGKAVGLLVDSLEEMQDELAQCYVMAASNNMDSEGCKVM
eukprot:1009115_1